MKQALQAIIDQLAAVELQIGTLDRAIHAHHRANDMSCRPETVPGIGVIAATAIASKRRGRAPPSRSARCTAKRRVFPNGRPVRVRPRAHPAPAPRGWAGNLGLFGLQVALAFIFRNDGALTIATLTLLAWACLAFAGVLFLVKVRQLAAILRAAFVSPSAAIERHLCGTRRRC